MHKGCIYTIISMVLLLSGCSSPSNTPEVQLIVPSMRDHYPILLEETRKWQSDAHLTLASVQISLDMESRNIATWIRAYFNSPSKDLESVRISMSQDGILEKEVIEHGVLISRYNVPIVEDDWQIDSTEAVDIFFGG